MGTSVGPMPIIRWFSDTTSDDENSLKGLHHPYTAGFFILICVVIARNTPPCNTNHVIKQAQNKNKLKNVILPPREFNFSCFPFLSCFVLGQQENSQSKHSHYISNYFSGIIRNKYSLLRYHMEFTTAATTCKFLQVPITKA